MCVIYVANRVLPEDSELARGGSKNDDGAGIAWVDWSKTEKDAKGKTLHRPSIRWKKGFEKPGQVKEFIKDMKLPLPLMIHFRTVSVGGKCDELTHPFPITENVELDLEGNAPSVLFHNGHINNWDDLMLQAAFSSAGIRVPEGPFSDTRAMAWLVALKGPGILPFIMKTSRVAILQADVPSLNTSKYKPIEHIRIWGSGQWVHKDGYSQSIDTGFSNRGGVTTYMGGHFSDEKKHLDECSKIKCHIPSAPEPPEPPKKEEKPKEEKSSHSQTRVLGPTQMEVVAGVGRTTLRRDEDFSADEWSLEQLRGILDLMKKEFEDAQVAAGI